MPLNSNDIIEALRTDLPDSSVNFDESSNSIRIVVDPFCPPGYAYYVPTAAWVDGIDTSPGTIVTYTGDTPVVSQRNEFIEIQRRLLEFYTDPPPEYSPITLRSTVLGPVHEVIHFDTEWK